MFKPIYLEKVRNVVHHIPTHIVTCSGKNSSRNGPNRMIPKLSGSSLLFIRLTLRGKRGEEMEDILILERKRTRRQVNKRGKE